MVYTKRKKLKQPIKHKTRQNMICYRKLNIFFCSRDNLYDHRPEINFNKIEYKHEFDIL